MTATSPVQLFALPGIPEITHGADLAAIIHTACAHTDLQLSCTDVVVVTSKIISKSLGLRSTEHPSDAVAGESMRVVAERRSNARVTRIVESAAGPVMAAAGVDASNTGPAGGLLLLPHSPDQAARQLLDQLR